MMALSGIQYGVYGYSAEVGQKADVLALSEQRLRDLEVQRKNGVTITKSGRDINHCIAVVTEKVEAARTAHERAQAEL